MSDEEEDYLSDKFLAQLEQSSSGKPRTYHDRRREVKRVSEQKNLTNRVRSRREIEEESRREGLSKSLFERAREEEDRARKRIKLSESDQDTSSPEVGEPEQTKNKALAMMLKMGYKEGQSLGRADELPTTEPKEDFTASASENRGASHLVEPLPLTMWAGMRVHNPLLVLNSLSGHLSPRSAGSWFWSSYLCGGSLVPTVQYPPNRPCYCDTR